MAKALGIGAVYLRCKHPHALARWYAKWLSFPMDSDFAALFSPRNMPDHGFTLWAALRSDTTYVGDKQDVMLCLAVDDLEGALKQVTEGGGHVLDDRREEDFGTFAWFFDPEGNKVELWQPQPDPGLGDAKKE